MTKPNPPQIVTLQNWLQSSVHISLQQVKDDVELFEDMENVMFLKFINLCFN